jgi:6-phosphogluconolactonase
MKRADIALSVFDGPATLAQSGAEQWVDQVRRAGNDRLSVALPGGRIYRLFFEAVVREAGRYAGVLDHVHFFWGDERCVPPDDEDSNFRLADDLLLQPLGISESQVHRIHGEDSPEAAASAAEAELRSVVANNANGVPVLDYVFLGMGEDGHVASLFPGEVGSAAHSPAVYRAVQGPKPPPKRITLGYGAIGAATNVWVLVSGPDKEGALRQSIIPGGGTPLARVISNRKETTILTDILLD